MILGQSRSADVRVEDPTVSGRHCEIVLRAGTVFLRDLGSKNGTFLAGARVVEAWCGVGAVVTFGTSTLTIHEGDGEGDEGADVAPLPGMVGQSFAMRRVAAQVRRLARSRSPVLICGETGTGKELIAHALHSEGPRRSGPFVPLNVATLPKDLVDAELFGFERGAFTGAVRTRTGAFADAVGGTLFLDEIGELTLDAQPKLLRALDGYQVRKIGASGGGAQADVRVVTATHVPLEEAVDRGQFRRDLFHRLEVFVIEIPPLRERRGDIAPIARELLTRLEDEVGPCALSPATIGTLCAEDWRGNVRDLRNTLLRAAQIARADETERGGLRERARIRIEPYHIQRAFRRARQDARNELTPSAARALVERFFGNIAAASRAAGVPRTTFRKVLARGA